MLAYVFNCDKLRKIKKMCTDGSHVTCSDSGEKETWSNFVVNCCILAILFEKVMFPKSFRHAGRVENMDEYLQSLGLWRKVIPKDGASLYRVVAEQVKRQL